MNGEAEEERLGEELLVDKNHRNNMGEPSMETYAEECKVASEGDRKGVELGFSWINE